MSAHGEAWKPCLAKAMSNPGWSFMRLATVKDGDVKQVSVEHSMGEFTVELRLHHGQLVSCGLMRTARLLLDGAVCVPANLWGGRGSSRR